MAEDAREGPAPTGEESGAVERILERLPAVEPTDRWVEMLAAIVLALATIASAWSAYQATRWSGVQATAFSEAAANRTESVRASNEGDQLVAIDVGVFTQWAAAVSTGNTELEAFLFERFRPEMKVAVEAWVATEPLLNPDAPENPFVMEEYQVARLQEARDLELVAEEKAAVARDANQTGDNYVLTTVLFASVLFFAGIASRFRRRTIKTLLLLLGAAAFVTGTAFLATFPVE